MSSITSRARRISRPVRTLAACSAIVMSMAGGTVALSLLASPAGADPAQLAQSVCESDGFWHVVTYDTTTWQVITDEPTSQPCQPAPTNVDPYPAGNGDGSSADASASGTQLARSECESDGFWHVVTYDISDPANWVVISDVATTQPCRATTDGGGSAGSAYAGSDGGGYAGSAYAGSGSDGSGSDGGGYAGDGSSWPDTTGGPGYGGWA